MLIAIIFPALDTALPIAQIKPADNFIREKHQSDASIPKPYGFDTGIIYSDA